MQQTEVQRGGAIIKLTTGECNIQKYFQGVPQSKVKQGNITLERNARECNIQMYFQGVSQSKELSGNAKIKSISRKCNNQKYCQEVSQVKVQPGSATIIRTARECYKQNASKVNTGSFAIKNTSREVTLKSTDRSTECHNQKYCQRLSHENVLPRVLLFKIHPGNDTSKYNAGECHKPIWLQGSVTI